MLLPLTPSVYLTAGENARMSRPENVTGCESDEIGQKMCLIQFRVIQFLKLGVGYIHRFMTVSAYNKK